MANNPYARQLPAENKWQAGRPISAPEPVLQEIIKWQDRRIRKLESEVAEMRLERWRWRREAASKNDR